MEALTALLLLTASVTAGLGSSALPTPSADMRSPAVAPAVAVPATEPTTEAVRPRSDPVRLRIPAIGVDTGLVPLGLEADGALEVPTRGFPAGWYTGAPTPGELGPAVLAGHVDWAGEPGVFYDLRQLRPGDEVSVVREDGDAVSFRVTRVEQFAKDRFPTELVYGDLDHAGLRLITCGGSFDRAARSYVDNLVVFAVAVPPGRA